MNLSFKRGTECLCGAIKPEDTHKWYFVLFFFYDTSEEKFLTSDLSFSQVTEVDKREPRESFSKPRPHF